MWQVAPASSIGNTGPRESKNATCRLWKLQSLKNTERERGLLKADPVSLGNRCSMGMVHCSHSKPAMSTLLGLLEYRASDGEGCPTGAQAQVQEWGGGEHRQEEELPV